VKTTQNNFVLELQNIDYTPFSGLNQTGSMVRNKANKLSHTQIAPE